MSRPRRRRDFDQEEVALIEVPDVLPRVDGRVWDGLEHQVRHPCMHSGTAQRPDCLPRSAGRARRVSARAFQASQRCVGQVDHAGRRSRLGGACRARRACRWLDRVICCSAAERAAVRGRRGLEALNYEQPRCPLHRPQDAGRHVELQLAVPACAQWPGIAGRQARRHRVCGHGRARHAAQAGPTWIGGHCLHESYTTSALANDDATTRKTQTFGRIG